MVKHNPAPKGGKQGNIYSMVPHSLKEELLEILLATKGFRMERIVSDGHATAPGEWYDQETSEWVILLTGSAGLLFEGERDVRVMGPGDYVSIPAHVRHRVEWTDKSGKTVWLSFHYNP
ncbi:MAG: cupin domain-containing protein [Syntrophobacterales bacterium]|jgi:cupin 2 domain-containing protein|nr:cupin domain-containing protein [Syntrophobacterales bacterium]